MFVRTPTIVELWLSPRQAVRNVIPILFPILDLKSGAADWRDRLGFVMLLSADRPVEQKNAKIWRRR